MTPSTVHAFPAHDGGAGSRDHVLVLPSVICTTLVAKQVAARTGAVTIRHQDGCGHIGDDVAHGSGIYSSLGQNPNVCATLVLSLGCETLQGATVAADLGDHGAPVDLVRLQDHGATATGDVADAAVLALRQRHRRERAALPLSALTVGVVADREDPALPDLVGRCLGAGARVVLAGSGAASLPEGCEHVAPAADGLQRVSLLAAAGASVVVSFPHPDQAPFSVSVVPVITVASASDLHTALADDFDVSRPEGDALWQLVVATVEGRPTASETSDLHSFSLPRLRRTM